MIICITGNFEIEDEMGIKTGKTEFLVSHGYDSETHRLVTLPNLPPLELGATFCKDIGEWVIE
jgi:hypothetical protein